MDKSVSGEVSGKPFSLMDLNQRFHINARPVLLEGTIKTPPIWRGGTTGAEINWPDAVEVQETEDGSIPMRELGVAPNHDSGVTGSMLLVDGDFRGTPVATEPGKPCEPDFVIDFTAEELMEEYMRETQMSPTDLAALVPKQRCEPLVDASAHQLVTPKCPIMRAVTLLRLLEDDVRTLERIQTATVEDAFNKQPPKKYEFVLDALVHSDHHSLTKVLRNIKRFNQVPLLLNALERMRYDYRLDKENDKLYLRCATHRSYGWIVI